MSRAEISNRLVSLAADIRAAHATITNTSLEMARRAVAAGHMLIEAKTVLPHGKWDAWLRDHAGLSARTARRYMQIARSGLETATVADLGIRGAAERLSKAITPAKTDLAIDPAYLAWEAEMKAALAAIPSEAAREQVLQVMWDQVQAEQLAAFLRSRMVPGELEKVSGWVERTDPKLVIKHLQAALGRKDSEQ